MALGAPPPPLPFLLFSRVLDFVFDFVNFDCVTTYTFHCALCIYNMQSLKHIDSIQRGIDPKILPLPRLKFRNRLLLQCAQLNQNQFAINQINDQKYMSIVRCHNTLFHIHYWRHFFPTYMSPFVLQAQITRLSLFHSADRGVIPDISFWNHSYSY